MDRGRLHGYEESGEITNMQETMRGTLNVAGSHSKLRRGYVRSERSRGSKDGRQKAALEIEVVVVSKQAR
jgi:hypothetical protein